MSFSFLSRLVLHLSACVAYPFVSYFGYWCYQKMTGVSITRGVDIGIAMWLIFYGFIAMNLVMVGMRRVVPRLVLLGVALISLALYLLPAFPWRALATAMIFGGLGSIAICSSRWLELKMSILARGKAG